jgi:hypothetical protein
MQTTPQTPPNLYAIGLIAQARLPRAALFWANHDGAIEGV